MNAIPYSELLAEVADLVGWDAEELDAQEFRQSRRAIGNALGFVWRYTWWPDLMEVERRTFHPFFDESETVIAGDIRFFPPSCEYYTALRGSSGQAPATLVGGDWTVNLAYWSRATRTLQAPDYDATVEYAVGDKVYFGEDFKTYQAHTLPPVGTDPDDTDYWGEVVRLDPVIPRTMTGYTPIGRVRAVYVLDPKVHRGASRIPWDETKDGLQIRECVNWPWVVFQRRAPLLTGEAWTVDQSFDAAGEETTVVVIPEASRGEYPAYATVGEARTKRITADRIDVLEDGNGDPATFWRDATYVDDGFDVTGFADAAGTAFRRIQRT